MDPLELSIIIGVCTLLIERVFSWAGKIKKSSCFGGKIEMEREDGKK
jgi:hypothetical protein